MGDIAADTEIPLAGGFTSSLFRKSRFVLVVDVDVNVDCCRHRCVFCCCCVVECVVVLLLYLLLIFCFCFWFFLHTHSRQFLDLTQNCTSFVGHKSKGIDNIGIMTNSGVCMAYAQHIRCSFS